MTIKDFLEDKFYFVLHAPRQSGKTTILQDLTSKINSDGQYYAGQAYQAYQARANNWHP
jgi:uncharacterized protein YukE